MKRFIQLLLAIVISINTVSYNPNTIFAIDNDEQIIEEINEAEDEIVIDDEEEIVVQDDEEEIIEIDDDEDIDVIKDEDVVVEENDIGILNDYLSEVENIYVVDEDNYEDVKSLLANIADILDTLSEEEIDNIDLSKYLEISNLVDEYLNSFNNEDEEEVVLPERETVTEDGYKLNYEHIDLDLSRYEHSKTSNLLRATTIPEKYSLLDNGYVTPVKNQNPFGSCWSFAAIAAAESSYLKQTGKTVDLSEMQLAWFTFNNIDKKDSLELITGDGSKTTASGDGILDWGGNQYYAYLTLASGVGYSYESDIPYPTTTGKTKPSDSLCYNHDYLLDKCEWLSMSEPDKVKQAILKNGAAAVSFYYSGNAISGDYGDGFNTSYYFCSDKFYDIYDDEYPSNHAVTVVGWDDNYSKDLFSEGYDIENNKTVKKKPATDGAWLIKNSWGSGWGNEGYFWISYCDASIRDSEVVFYSMRDLDTNETYDIYQYDGSAYDTGYGYSSSKTVWGANVYTTQKDELLTDVSFVSHNAQTNVTVYIYKDVTSTTNPKSGTLVDTISGSYENSGYYTIHLDDPIVLSSGTKFSIVIKFEYYGSESQTLYLACGASHTYTGGTQFVESVASGQSYISKAGSSFEDLYDDGACARIKAICQEYNPIEDLSEIYLGFTSDIHNENDNTQAGYLRNWIDNVSTNKIKSKFLNFISCGDMGKGSSSTLAADTYWTYAQNAIDVIRNSNNVIRKGFFVLGNHEFDNGKFDSSTNATRNYYTTNGKSYEDNDGGYILYSFGATSGTSNNIDYYIQEKDVDALDSFLSKAPTNKPIFVVSHYPLHLYGNRIIHGLGETIDVLNKYGDDHTIIFVWGHSHSLAGTSSSSEKHYDQVFEGEITDYDKNGTPVNINFTYASAGCMSDTGTTGSANVKGKGLVAKIEDNKVILTYYDKNYNVVGTPTTINYKTGTPQSTRYTVNFDAGDGTASYTSKSVMKGSTYGKLPTASKKGFDFVGWFTSAEGGTQITPDSKVNISSTQTLYAHYTIKKITVTFDKNNGNNPSYSSKQYTYGEPYGDLPTGSRTGYKFLGWYTASSGGTLVTIWSTVDSEKDITLYAHYSYSSNLIKVTLDPNYTNGKTVAVYVTKNSTYGELPSAVRTGFTFNGWYTSTTGGDKITSSSKIGNQAVTLYAHWIGQKYTVSFDSTGGSSCESIQVASGTEYGNLPSPTKEGYTFDGWYTKATGGDPITNTTVATMTSDQTLYAHWSVAKYTVSFDSTGGSACSSIQVSHNGTYGTLPSTTRTGYQFDGWYYNGAKVISTTTIKTNADHKLVASWTANTYNVKFNANDGSGTMGNQSFTYGVAQNLSENKFTRTGYTFAGWATSSTGSVVYSDKQSVSNLTSDNNVTYNLYAKWTANKHKVTFDSAGGSACSQIEVTYDGYYTNLPTSTRTGYDFAGWYRNDTKVEKTDKVKIDAAETLVAHWTIKKYTVTWKNDDGTVLETDTNVEYGSMPSYDGEEPTKASTAQYTYTFKGWDKTPTVVTGDVTYTATYTSTTRKYDVSIVVNNGEYGTVSTNKVSVDYGTVINKASTTTPNKITVGTTTITATPTTKTAQYTYAFTGWSITTSTTVRSDLTITANFSRTTNTYTVKFVNDDNTVLKSSTLEYGDMPSYSGTPTKAASAQYTYTFNGWDKTIAAVTGDVTYKATYTATLNKYTVTFNNNGHGGTTGSQTITYGSKVSKPSDLSATGYTFGGWYKEQACTNAWNFDTDTITGDKTLYAKWTANKYNINYVLNDGNYGTYHPTTATYNTEFTVSNPTRTGYSFAGWKITGMDTGTHTYGSSTTTSTTINSTKAITYKNLHATNNATVTFTASWTEADVNYKVNHYLMNVTGSGYTLNKTTTESGKSNSSVTISSLKNEDYTGFTYEGGKGRTTTSSSKPASFDTSVTISPSGNTVVDIFYSRNKYTVTFNANGHGNAPTQLTNVYYGAKISSPGSLSVTGYTFGGWYKEQACTNAWNFDTDTITGDKTLYAKWTANSNTAYKIQHYQEKLDGTYELKDTENKTGTTGSSVTASSKSYTGFTYDSSNTYNVKTGTISGDGNLTLKLYYNRNTHTVTFKDGSTTLKRYDNVKYGTAISSLSGIPTPTKTGYTFDGWDPSITSLTLDDDNLTITAKWSDGDTAYVVNHYLMNVSGSGYTKNSTVNKTGKSNATITLSTLQDTFTGFTYDGGKSVTTTSSTKPSTYDTTATIKANGTTVIDLYYTRNRYTVTLNTGTGIASTSGANTYYFGATVGINANVSTGYTWSKWTNGSSDVSTTKEYSFTMPSNNVTYTANATANTYSVRFYANGGSGTMSNQSFTYGESKALTLNKFTQSGYTFIGWSTSQTGSVLYTDGQTVKNLTSTNGGVYNLYAIWEKESDNTVSINKGSSLSIGDTVYVNGKAVKVNSSGKIVTEKADNYVITKYTIANSSDSDRHTQYPSKTEVFFVDGSNNAVLNSNFTDILKYAGASIRITGDKGIRIITSIPTSVRNSLVNSSYNGYKAMEYGTVMCWASDLKQGEEPTIQKNDKGEFVATHGAKGRAYSRNDKINAIFKEGGGVTQYTNTLVGDYSNAECASDFAMRSYIILRPTTATDGSKDIVIYGGTLFRSISYVAYQNRNAFNPGTAAYEYIWNLIKAGYGSKYDSEYKKG